jgi:tyrosine-protein phosphatase non-receptor type 14/21
MNLNFFFFYSTQELDIPRVVALLRHQRMLMIQTVAQYRFVYSLLIYYLKHSRLI